jgi:hypothetical protein
VDEELLSELGQSLLYMTEATIAAEDMLALLCMHFAKASPGPAAELLTTVKKMRESELVERTQAFAALARRIEQALGGDHDLPFLSLKLPTARPASPEELRSRLRVIRGGVE